MHVIGLTLLGIAAWSLACAGGEWGRVRTQDSPSTYRRFLREHPDSRHAAEARERLDYLQLKNDPSPQAFERFRTSYPESVYRAELEALLEEPTFDAALRQGTAEAFQAFLERFPSGRFTARARGNVAYFAMGGAFATPQQLAEFERLHPESDYAEEARRTLAALALRHRSPIRVIGLRTEIDPSTPGADRLATRFRELALETYRSAGLQLVFDNTRVDAWLSIRHGEASVGTEVSDGQVTQPGLLAQTEVTLTRAGETKPIWSKTFSLRTSEFDRRSGTSVLLSAAARSYWSEFFVPVVTWSTDAARRPVLRLPKEAVAVDTRRDRAGALFADGSFQLFNLADPSKPRSIFEYARPRDLERFSGVRLAGSRVVLFGEDGLEILAPDGETVQVERSFDRAAIGSVEEVVAHGTDLLVAGTRGLLRVSLTTHDIETLLGTAVRDLALDGTRLVLIDDESLYAADLSQLRQGRADTQFRLGKGFEPSGVLAAGGLAVLLSPHGLVSFDVSDPRQPRKLSWLRPSQTGTVHDAAIAAGRVFLLGNRGLQVLDPRSGRIVDSVDLESRARVAAAGRFLVAVGSEGLQVVDASPWTTPFAPAASE